jgi:hypothetical protein
MFGLSKSGGCTRGAGLKLLGAEPEPFSGSTHVTFLIGHLVEVLAIAALRRVGYRVNGAQQPVAFGPFHSYSDGIIDGLKGINGPAILSVKSTGYKKSGKQGSRWVRQGFPALPFEGVRQQHPGWYAQAQAEMHGSGLGHALILVVAKDIIKSMEGDPYLGAAGNGSLTFYGELIKYDPVFIEEHLMPVWEEAWEDVGRGVPPRPLYLRAGADVYVELSPASTDWEPNASRTGSFNPCSYCDLLQPCRDATEGRNFLS